jgi:hypothetical protein
VLLEICPGIEDYSTVLRDLAAKLRAAEEKTSFNDSYY